MTTLEDRWPVVEWRLTAPESYVLRYGTGGYAHEAFKLAVKELVARRALRIHRADVRSFGRVKTVGVLSEGPYRADEPSLTPVLESFTELDASWLETDSGTVRGIGVRTFARAAAKKFTPSWRQAFIGYRDLVIHLLVNRGLVGEGPKFERTPAGRHMDDELDDWLRIGRERLAAWMATDPARAVAYAGGAGPALLLVSHLYGVELGGLSQHAAVLGSGGGGDGGLDFAGLDFGGLDLGGLGDAFGSIDIALGGGDGGGGGGGGDGGGGGGG